MPGYDVGPYYHDLIIDSPNPNRADWYDRVHESVIYDSYGEVTLYAGNGQSSAQDSVRCVSYNFDEFGLTIDGTTKHYLVDMTELDQTDETDPYLTTPKINGATLKGSCSSFFNLYTPKEDVDSFINTLKSCKYAVVKRGFLTRNASNLISGTDTTITLRGFVTNVDYQKSNNTFTITIEDFRTLLTDSESSVAACSTTVTNDGSYYYVRCDGSGNIIPTATLMNNLISPHKAPVGEILVSTDHAWASNLNLDEGTASSIQVAEIPIETEADATLWGYSGPASHGSGYMTWTVCPGFYTAWPVSPDKSSVVLTEAQSWSSRHEFTTENGVIVYPMCSGVNPLNYIIYSSDIIDTLTKTTRDISTLPSVVQQTAATWAAMDSGLDTVNVSGDYTFDHSLYGWKIPIAKYAGITATYYPYRLKLSSSDTGLNITSGGVDPQKTSKYSYPSTTDTNSGNKTATNDFTPISNSDYGQYYGKNVLKTIARSDIYTEEYTFTVRDDPSLRVGNRVFLEVDNELMEVLLVKAERTFTGAGRCKWTAWLVRNSGMEAVQRTVGNATCLVHMSTFVQSGSREIAKQAYADIAWSAISGLEYRCNETVVYRIYQTHSGQTPILLGETSTQYRLQFPLASISPSDTFTITASYGGHEWTPGYVMYHDTNIDHHQWAWNDITVPYSYQRCGSTICGHRYLMRGEQGSDTQLFEDVFTHSGECVSAGFNLLPMGV